MNKISKNISPLNSFPSGGKVGKGATAILIFAQSAARDAQDKNLGKSLQLFETLNAKTIGIARKSGLPYFVFTEREQRGDTFGERYTDALQRVFDKGFEHVISIGNDSPQLTLKHITKTAKLLESQKLVLGPSADGGFYLMGIHKSQFNAALFLKLPWQKSSLANSIARLLSAQKIEVSWLEQLVDIDDLASAKKLLHQAQNLAIIVRKLIARLIDNLRVVFAPERNQKEILLIQNLYNKGSPLFKIS